LTASHDYNPDQPNVPLAPDTVLQERYRIVRQLGRGGMGAVYEAEDQRLGITVALKETLSSESSMRKQFEREARMLAGMQHPALPRVTDHFVEGNRAFLVMQFIGGVDLARIISQQPGPFPRDQVIAWADQLLDALIYLHSRDRQVIHRDIKPHNLKLTATGQIALLDFGLAKAQPSDPSVTSSQAFFGYTRHYAPLEQIQDQRTDPRSDIYALGATLYHLLTGVKPPDAMVRAAAVVNSGQDPLLSAHTIHPAVGSQVAAILDKAMAQKPEGRYSDAKEFREALRRIGRTKNAGVDVEQTDRAKIRVQSAPGTIHISELASMDQTTLLPASDSSALNMTLVGSAKRFGPAGATATLAIVLTLAGGILYASQRWFPPTEEATAAANSAAPERTAATLRQPGASRKSERARSDNILATVTDPTDSNDANTARPAIEKKNFAETSKTQIDKRRALVSPTPQAEKKQALAAKSPNISSRSQEPLRAAPRKELRRIGAPSIRLPNPELRDNSPAPSPDSRTRTFGSSNAIPTSAPPKFYRAADGTQIVKFPDGSTQYIRPGQRTARSDVSNR
jgi:serine/threonine protein kinase